jgi:hypothetical protein
MEKLKWKRKSGVEKTEFKNLKSYLKKEKLWTHLKRLRCKYRPPLLFFSTKMIIFYSKKENIYEYFIKID